jgi:hypothetical protein
MTETPPMDLTGAMWAPLFLEMSAQVAAVTVGAGKFERVCACPLLGQPEHGV